MNYISTDGLTITIICLSPRCVFKCCLSAKPRWHPGRKTLSAVRFTTKIDSTLLSREASGQGR
eukprot:3770211-Lingulodinium_polyedra.AAC.1